MRQGSHLSRLVVIACFVTLMPELNAQEAASLSPNVAAIAVHDATSDIGTVKAGSRQVSPRDSVAVEGQRVTARSVVRISVRENGRLLVPVSINGKKECRFLFDTGATISVVSERLATKMGVSVKSTVRVQTFAGAVSLAVGQVDTLQVGNHSIVGSEVLIGDLGNSWPSGTSSSQCTRPWRFDSLKHRRIEIWIDRFHSFLPTCTGNALALFYSGLSITTARGW